MIDYTRYMYTWNEKLRYGTAGGAGAFAVLMLFYSNGLLCMLLSVPAAIGFLKYYRRPLMERRRWELTIQFKDAMECMVSAMVAGYSLENSVRQARRDLALMYEEGDIILQELEYMTRKMELRVSVEALIQELGARSGVEDIITFGEILATAKRTGGNLVRVMRRTSANIAEKTEIKREIGTLIAGKKMESRCMTAIPLLMIVYLRVFSPGFLDPLYNNLPGAAMMTGALVICVVSFLWGQKIMRIEF